ncbi:MAG: NAD(P)H-quinone oxidoreductase [Exilibacterium sp.]
MKYIEIGEFGAADVLRLQEAEAPEHGDDELLIKVVAAGVNRPDIVQRRGAYPPPPGASPILGLEVAGEVVAVGNNVRGWRQGDNVCALTNGGGYAERVAVPACQCLPVPVGLSLQDAAAVPETFFTVWSNVFDRGNLKTGESLLVHGGSSGIGTAAIQMAAARGARVFTTAGSEEKCQACRELGAEIAVNYREKDFVAVLTQATGKQGVDVILDMVGGDYISRNVALAAMDGRIINIAYLQGATAEVNFLPIMLKRLTLTGSTLRPQSPATKAAIAENLRRHIWPLIEAGKIKPVIARRFPLAEAAAAHRFMESGRHIGKIVLTVA